MNWFSSPNTWDELKEQKDRLQEDLREANHRIRVLESHLQVANKRIEAEVEIAVNIERSRHKTELVQMEQKLQQKFYEKASKNLEEVMIKGSQQSKFIQEMALKMVEQSPNIKKIDVS